MKKYVFLMAVVALLLTLASGHWAVAGLFFAAFFVWLLLETKRRQKFRFLARASQPERLLSLPELHTGFVAEHSAHALLVEHGTKLSLANFDDGRLLWQKSFAAAQAVAIGPQGQLYYATETELVLCDEHGKDKARLSFEPPLYRQSYRILISKDGGTVALQTPWFTQFVAPDLSALGQRLRFEDAGHYLKYAALADDGRGLLLAGALLLEDDEENSSAMEARWDYWTRSDEGVWSQVWAKAYESYNNTHLRGVAIRGPVLLAEVYQQGYEFRLYRADGQPHWERPGGERALLSPQGQYLVWQNAFDELILSRVSDKQELWKRKFEAYVRLKAVDEKGRVLLVEGRHLSVLGLDGQVLWRDHFQEDPTHLALGPRGRLLVMKGQMAGFIQVPFDV